MSCKVLQLLLILILQSQISFVTSLRIWKKFLVEFVKFLHGTNLSKVKIDDMHHDYTIFFESIPVVLHPSRQRTTEQLERETLIL